MSYALRYSATRQDVWTWYWRRWRDGAWLRQLLFALAISAYPAWSGRLGLLGFLLVLAVAFLLVVIAFAAWPQLAFKPQERLLEVNPTGWSTRIGKKSGSKSWADVASVCLTDTVVVITSRTGNALLVPQSAFSNAEEQRRFASDAQTWHQGHAV